MSMDEPDPTELVCWASVADGGCPRNSVISGALLFAAKAAPEEAESWKPSADSTPGAGATSLPMRGTGRHISMSPTMTFQFGEELEKEEEKGKRGGMHVLRF